MTEVLIEYIEGPHAGNLGVLKMTDTQAELYEVGSTWSADDGTARFVVLAQRDQENRNG
jgi:hypothetical protein